MLLTLLFIALLFYVVYLFVKYQYHAIGTRYRPDLKGRKGWPIFGNTELISLSPIYNMYDLRKEYGPVVYVLY
jgi:hypothetical protein